jgi:hypothetical protein
MRRIFDSNTGQRCAQEREELKKWEATEKKGQENGGDDGARTRDLRRDRPAL